MLSALSNGVTLPTKFFELGISGKIACAIIGVPASRLSLCVSGVQDLSARDAERLHGLCKMLTRHFKWLFRFRCRSETLIAGAIF
jgi:hypothetical protein